MQYIFIYVDRSFVKYYIPPFFDTLFIHFDIYLCENINYIYIIALTIYLVFTIKNKKKKEKCVRCAQK